MGCYLEELLVEGRRCKRERNKIACKGASWEAANVPATCCAHTCMPVLSNPPAGDLDKP